MTIHLYTTLTEMLPRTPIKFHYIFNLRDLSRIYEGLCRSTVDYFPTPEKFVRLWRNEATRVFADKLINIEDRQLITNISTKLITDNFAELAEVILEGPLLYGDFMNSKPEDPEYMDPKIY
jgi:dynein heavy chain